MENFTTPVKNRKETFTIPESPFLKRLGYGTGVNVYKFERSPRCSVVQSPWALKIVKKAKETIYGARLRTEAEFLRKMNHPYIVSFRAFTETSEGDKCLAMEACNISLGDLIEARAEDRLPAFEPNKILKMAFHISKALDYIHKRMLLLHGDIKSYNVLIKGDFEVCKLCDFGVSLPLKRNGYLDVDKVEKYAIYVGTESWCAPEVIQDPRNVTDKADIFPFGLVIWEMIALTVPHSSVPEESDNFGEDHESFGTRPAIPYEMLGDNPTEYNCPLQLFYCCTETNRNCRPNAHQLSVEAYNMLHPEEEEEK